ncbi:hypothetical protein K431DRAFT_338000 [Polychaeton citri CBS 116435]|uniref:Foie gras liver health family 1 n=1 Tax=Polychaeton citri CBS 116435 TaxID=1314669 RepID=A0A9P4Q8N0_9PEZI|nr:hypothetical protein K431DRAFT_338000 [Polychaeton citri CBS 116435]
MEAYPNEYVEHNVPLILLSGLGQDDDGASNPTPSQRQESGTRIVNNSPDCRNERAPQLLQGFLSRDGRDNAWNSTGFPGPTGPMRFKMQQIGRTYVLPPRKAAPPPQTAEEGPANPSAQMKQPELHSPLSPLSPGSPIFPEGVFTPSWLHKHQHQVPALILAFFDIRAQGTAEDDETTKNDINAIRISISRSGYKSRFAVVLLSDSSILQSPNFEDRLSLIRRSTSLDPKTGLFFMPPMSSQAEIATLVQGIMATLQPGIVEYYRDLTKHARRKKTRGSTPNPAAFLLRGTSQSLSSPGWNVRYEVKQGVFAEFRQEMDVAERHYSVAIDELFSAEGIFETTPSWSPRWVEARLLCDAMAWRVLRCQLWMSETTGAAQSWNNYRWRMKDLIDRRGKGSLTYGWEAWEARWARMMAQLIGKAQLQTFAHIPDQTSDDATSIQSQLTYAMPEKSALNSERLPPFEFMHRAAYWHLLSAKKAEARWERAQAIPDEDRTPPGQTQASSVANRTRIYDTYLVPDPHEEAGHPDEGGYEHLKDITAAYSRAIDDFKHHDQIRMAEQCRLDLGLALEKAGHWDDARQLLVPLWQETVWRDEHWHECFAILLQCLQRCLARSDKYASFRLAIMWELLHQDVATHGLVTQTNLDFSSCLDQPDVHEGERTKGSVTNKQLLSPILGRLSFDSKEGHVGEPIMCQLTLESVARKGSTPIVFNEVSIGLTNGYNITLSDETTSTSGASKDSSVIKSLSLISEKLDVFTTQAALSFEPGQKRIFNFTLTFREARVIGISQLKFLVRNPVFEWEHSFTGECLPRSKHWIEDANSDTPVLRSLNHDDTASVQILPKSPKVQMLAHHLRKRYYSGEIIKIDVELLNQEAEIVNSKIAASLISDGVQKMHLEWANGEAELSPDLPKKSDLDSEVACPLIHPSAAHHVALNIHGPDGPGRAILNLDVRYTLESDPEVPLVKSMSINLTFVQPFEATFTFAPLLNSEPWPSFFNPATAKPDSPCGIPQKWRFGSHVTVLATEQLFIKQIDIEVQNPAGDMIYGVTPHQDQQEDEVAESSKIERIFELLTQKRSLDDRRSAALESNLVMRWCLINDGPIFITRIPAPRLSIPSSEPRVLCTVDQAASLGGAKPLHYHLENPSMHFLTFAITMEASEEFAFGGPKYRTLSLAPMSRIRIDYSIIPYGDSENIESAKLGAEGEVGRWIWPSLQVVDSYYQKTLRVQAGGPGTKSDEKGNIGVLLKSF